MIELRMHAKIATKSKLPIGVGQAIQVGQTEIALFKLANGKVYALENRSPHPKGGPLVDGLISGEYVYCPMYDWKISLATGEVQAPDEGHVRSFPLHEENDLIYLIK